MIFVAKWTVGSWSVAFSALLHGRMARAGGVNPNGDPHSHV